MNGKVQSNSIFSTKMASKNAEQRCFKMKMESFIKSSSRAEPQQQGFYFWQIGKMIKLAKKISFISTLVYSHLKWKSFRVRFRVGLRVRFRVGLRFRLRINLGLNLELGLGLTSLGMSEVDTVWAWGGQMSNPPISKYLIRKEWAARDSNAIPPRHSHESYPLHHNRLSQWIHGVF